MSGPKMLAVAVGVIAPLIIWVALYVAAHFSSNLRSTLGLIKALRWIGWCAGALLFVVHFGYDGFPWAYGIALLAFSSGMAIQGPHLSGETLSS